VKRGQKQNEIGRGEIGEREREETLKKATPKNQNNKRLFLRFVYCMV
jgi:hypothetical protein